MFSAAIAACAPSVDSESGLTISLALEQNTYQLGQPISSTLTLENTSSTPLLFQARMVLNMRQLCPTDSCDLYFAISDPMGKELEFQWLARVRSIEQNDFEEISPGEQRQFQVNLSYYYASFDRLGQCTNSSRIWKSNRSRRRSFGVERQTYFKGRDLHDRTIEIP